MAANDKVSDGAGLTDFSVDPNVRVPDHVKASAALAETIHQQAYAPPEPTPEEKAAAEEATRAAEAEAAAQAQQVQQPAQDANQPLQQEQPQRTGVSGDDEGISATEWKHRFLSMKGRHDAQSRTLGTMQQQMQELGDEVVRLNSLLSDAPASNSQNSRTQNNSRQDHAKLITDQDRDTYGDELIDVVSRAAKQVIAPELDALKNENQSLKKQVITQAQRDTKAQLRQAVPDWVAINNTPQFQAWLNLPNIYTGQVRRQMLNAAYQAADAPKVIAFYNDFLMEVRATGQTLQTPQVEQQQPSPAPAPRQAAVDLGTLAAPGRAKPASGDSQVPADKPFITRAQISKFYDDKRRGFYAGREAQAAQFEADLTVAQREGRVRG